jgi:hypothetical protein
MISPRSMLHACPVKFTLVTACPVEFPVGNPIQQGGRISLGRHALCAMLVIPLGLHALCAMRSVLCHQSSALCTMLVAPPGFGDSLTKYPIKLHQLTMRVELFYFELRTVSYGPFN